MIEPHELDVQRGLHVQRVIGTAEADLVGVEMSGMVRNEAATVFAPVRERSSTCATAAKTAVSFPFHSRGTCVPRLRVPRPCRNIPASIPELSSVLQFSRCPVERRQLKSLDGERHRRELQSRVALVIALISSGPRSMLAAAMFCSTCSGEPDPGIGRICGDLASSQASATCRSVTP